jgi:hypothetical protein
MISRKVELTLHLDGNLVKKAQSWAQVHQISLDEAIANFLRQLPNSEQPLKLSAWTQSLVGVLPVETESNYPSQDHQEYLEYLEEKYR